MSQQATHDSKTEARFSNPIVATVDPLGYLEAAGPIPAQEMGLRPGRRIRLVGTAYDPNTVGAAYQDLRTTPRFLVRNGCSDAARRSGNPTQRIAYQSSVWVRVAKRGEETHVVYRMHEPDLAGRKVAMVSTVKRRGMAVWLAIPACLAVLLAAVVVGATLGWRDPNAIFGQYEGKNEEEIQDDLTAEVDWSAMEISVASAMVVEEGSTSVEARLENVIGNHCDQKIRMYETNNPSDVLYESGAIAPGEYLQFVELTHPLSVGTHDVTVEFQGYERSPALVSNEGVVLGHDTFGASCAAEVSIYCTPGGNVQA